MWWPAGEVHVLQDELETPTSAGRGMSSIGTQRRPEYLRMLVGILVAYVIIIGFGDTVLGDAFRVAVFGFLLWTAARLRTERRLRRWALAVAVVMLVATACVSAFGAAWLISAVVGGCSFILIGAAIATIASTLLGRWVVDTATVLGVLCIYLLSALFFATLYEFLAALIHPYLNGTPDPPTPSDLLYFSVITLTTVGFGDINPASTIARAVTVTEALTGQLYIVSVVAGVVGGWRAAGQKGPP
jgi:hypothetical protein